MQDAFARALVQPPMAIDDLDAWLFRVVHNLAVDHHRRVARARTLEIVESFGGDDSATRIALWQLVDRLPVRQRAVVYLRYRADLPFSTIARVLGITEAGARASLSRALDAMREVVTR